MAAARIRRKRKDYASPGLVGRKIKRRGQDTNHGVAFVVELDASTENTGIACKVALPKSRTEKRDVIAPEFVLIAGERASEDRLHVQQLEKLGGNHQPPNPFWMIAPGEIEGLASIGRHQLETVVLVGPISEIGIRTHVSGRPVGSRPHTYQLVRIAIRQWPQQDSFHHTEDGSIGANSQGQSEHGNQREPGALAQLAHGEPHVLDKSAHFSYLLTRSAAQPWDRPSLPCSRVSSMRAAPPCTASEKKS